MDSIVLIGFMGSGKTTLGVKLAQVFDYHFIDTDSYIEEKTGLKISQIFQHHGEAHFRNLENQCLQEISDSKVKCVLSTGGGLPLRTENATILHQIGTVIFLKTSIEVTYERLRGDTKRPLLQCANPLQRIEELLNDRTPIYESVADYTITTDNKSFYGLIEDIKKLI